MLMAANLEDWCDYGRVLLGGMRLFNGAAAIFTPKLLARQFGDNPNSAVIYALRLFGVRTIIVGIELLVPDEGLRASALRYAIPIHASDTLSAALAGMQGQLPSRTSIMLTAISGINTTPPILAPPHRASRIQSER